MFKPILFTVAVTGAILAGSLAGAQTADETAAPAGASLASIVQAFEARGFTVHEIDSEDGRYEIEATGPDAGRIEAVVDAASGEILQERQED